MWSHFMTATGFTQAISSFNNFNHECMNVQLPPEPTGDVPLPEHHQNPPSLKDITNAIGYNTEL